jgi:hypothetical protein
MATAFNEMKQIDGLLFPSSTARMKATRSLAMALACIGLIHFRAKGADVTGGRATAGQASRDDLLSLFSGLGQILRLHRPLLPDLSL